MDKKKQVISPETAILAVMSEAVYDAHSKGEMQGAHSRERVDRSLAEAA